MVLRLPETPGYVNEIVILFEITKQQPFTFFSRRVEDKIAAFKPALKIAPDQFSDQFTKPFFFVKYTERQNKAGQPIHVMTEFTEKGRDVRGDIFTGFEIKVV